MNTLLLTLAILIGVINLAVTFAIAITQVRFIESSRPPAEAQRPQPPSDDEGLVDP